MTSDHVQSQNLATALPAGAAAVDATPIAAAEGASSAEDRQHIRQLMLYFGLVYVVEGMCQTGGIIAQPLSYYLKEVHSFTPVQLTAFLTVFNLPWVIKPLYGLMSDFVPLFGYRRKTYLIAANAVAVVAYFVASQVSNPSHLVWALLLTAYAMAISSTICGALLVENGQRYSASGQFVNQQWLWYNIAAIAAALVGGQLIERLTPTAALHGAALIAAAAPLAVVLGTWMLVSEQRRPANLAELRNALRGLTTAFKTRALWIVAVFIFFYWFSPGFATPLYFYQTDVLHFSQGYIGVLGAVTSAGSVTGALFYRLYLTKLTSRRLLQLSIVAGTAAVLSYLMLFDAVTAAVLNFINGFAQMIALVATLTLAADYCPKRSEGFSYAALMSVSNLAIPASDNAGSFLYQFVFASQLTPLILVSAAFTAFAWLLIPLLRLGDKPQGHAVHV
jgi:MFS family permease